MGDDHQSSIADTYLANLERKGRGEAEAWRQDFDALIHHLSKFITFRPGTRILEVGSGSGWFLILCGLRGWECRGIEINSRLIEYARESARRNGVELDIINGSIDTSDIGTDRYDVIVATSVFEHVEHWQAGVQAIADALAPGGVFYFYSTNRWYPRSGEHPLPFYSYCPRRVRYRLQQWRWGSAIMQYGIDFHHFTHGQLRRSFRQAGFSTVLDTYDLMDPDRLGMPTWWKKTLLRSIKGHAWLKEVALALHHGTMFVCIKDAGTER
jgi:2-polyprenyl-3-methyl-5-hydroxy-6-metoxy-1,4-benzoquinol methylase